MWTGRQAFGWGGLDKGVKGVEKQKVRFLTDKEGKDFAAFFRLLLNRKIGAFDTSSVHDRWYSE